MIIASGVLAAIIVLFAAVMLVTPKYSASITLYANNSNSADIQTSLSSQDISASVQLVDTYAAIILSDPVLDQVIEINSLDMTGAELLKCIKITSVNNTEVFKVTVEYPSAAMAANIANSIAEIAPIKIADIVEGCSVKIVSNAKVPEERSFPSYRLAVAAGLVFGAAVSVLIIFIRALLDTRIKQESDLQRWDYPVLGNIPSFADAEKTGAYAYAKKGGK